jgi:hypothetical protein
MSKTKHAIMLGVLLLPFAAGAENGTPATHSNKDADPAALEAKREPCPTKVEIQPYIWIEPTTGNEYTVLRLHCPGRDDMDDDALSIPSRSLPDQTVPAAIRGAS